MQILSGALPANNSFLHVGYLSVAPREWGQNSVPQQTMQLLLDGIPVDVAEALRLEGEAQPVRPSAIEVGPVGALGMRDTATLSTLGFLFSFVFGLMMLYSARKHLRTHRVRGLVEVTLAACCAVGIVVSLLSYALPNPYSLPSPDTPPPWQGVALRAYADPAAATRVLMHGILSDAISNAGDPVYALTQVREEVGLPARNLTEGERYALQTYGLDGWGHPFQLEGRNLDELKEWFRAYNRGSRPKTSPHPYLETSPQYVLTSAGPDGKFKTRDDLRTTVMACVEYNWDEIPRAPYLYRDSEQLLLLFHRWKGENFRYANRDFSRRLFNNVLYDLIAVDPMSDSRTHPQPRHFLTEDLAETVRRNYDSVASQTASPPLVLMLPPAREVAPKTGHSTNETAFRRLAFLEARR